MLLDEFVPKWDFREDCTVKVKAPIDVTYRAIMEFTLAEVSPLVRVLSFLRTLPEKMVGRKYSTSDYHMPYLPQECRDFFTELAREPPHEFVCGLIVPGDIGRVWKKSSDLNFRATDAQEFKVYTDPSHLKVAMSICLCDSGEPESIKLRAEWRIGALSPQARKKFTLYWRIIGPFSHLIQKSLVKAVKRRAEKGALNNLKLKSI